MLLDTFFFLIFWFVNEIINTWCSIPMGILFCEKFGKPNGGVNVAEILR